MNFVFEYYPLLAVAAVLWFVSQVNTLVNSWQERKNIPLRYWISAAADFGSGLALFYFLFTFVKDLFVFSKFVFELFHTIGVV